jgi:hypothetical protein
MDSRLRSRHEHICIEDKVEKYNCEHVSDDGAVDASLGSGAAEALPRFAELQHNGRIRFSLQNHHSTRWCSLTNIVFPYARSPIQNLLSNAKMTDKPPLPSHEEATAPVTIAPPVQHEGADEDSDPDFDDLDGRFNSGAPTPLSLSLTKPGLTRCPRPVLSFLNCN